MNWTNYHMHSHYCDGTGQLEAYVKKAIDKKMLAIGFSGHAPAPFITDWHMKKTSLTGYIKEINSLKNKYNNDIKIYSGLEVDYIPEIIGPTTYRKQHLDIIIGSIHYVGQFENGEHCCIDNTTEEFEKGLKEVFGNDIKKLVGTYYEIMVSMIKNDTPDVIGHLDIIKKLNRNNRYFNEQDDWYRNILTDVLKAVSTEKCIVEVNTRGYYKGITREFYPSKWILEKCFNLNIPITISSDAHRPNDIDNGMKEAASTLLDIGYNQVNIFNEGEWHKADLKSDGLEL